MDVFDLPASSVSRTIILSGFCSLREQTLNFERGPPLNMHKHISFKVTDIRGHRGRHGGTNGVVYSISIRRLIPDVWSHWPGCQIKAFVLKWSLLKKKLPHSLIKKEPVWHSFMSEACIVKAKCGGWGIQTAGTPQRQLSRRASQQHILTETETSYDTSTTRVGGGGRGTVPSLCWSRHAQHWTKSVPNPEAARGRPKPKSKGHFFFFFCRGRILCSTLFPPRCCCRWAGQGAENRLQHWTMRGDASNQGVEQSKNKKKRAGGRLTLSSHGILDPITREYLRERLRAWQRY